MASSIQSAGQAVRATSGASTTSKPRRKATPEQVAVRMFEHAQEFAPASIPEGHARGQRAAFELLQQVRELIGPRGDRQEHAHEAFSRLRDFISHAGAARLAVNDDGHDRGMSSRQWAGFEALRPMIELVLIALPHVDLAAWQRQEQERLHRDDGWIVRRQAEARAGFVQRMRQGREQAQARRAQGGAA
jgi:hypothetical protein